MYEVEIRSLVDDFEGMKNKLDRLAAPTQMNEKEATIFFFSPKNDSFDLRLRLRKDSAVLSFKEGASNTARKEIESAVSSPQAVYELLRRTGFQIRMVIARIKYTYKYDGFEILLNRVIDWGNAIEVETMIEDPAYASNAETEIKDFMQSKLGLTNSQKGTDHHRSQTVWDARFAQVGSFCVQEFSIL